MGVCVCMCVMVCVCVCVCVCVFKKHITDTVHIYPNTAHKYVRVHND